MTIWRIIILLVFLINCNFLLLAQSHVLDPNKAISQYTLKTWTGDDGLPSIALTDLVQMDDQYLWVSTYNGIAKFDGVSFDVFNMENTPALKSNSVTSLALRNGVLWAGTLKGVMKYENYSFVQDPKLEQVNFASIEELFADSKGGMWIGTTSNGLFYYHNEKLEYFNNNILLESPVQAIVEDADGGIWVGTDKGSMLYLVDGQVKKVFASDFTSGVTCMYLDKQQKIWIGADQGIFNVIDGEVVKNDRLSFTDVVDITEDEFGNMWFSNNHGVFRYFVDADKLEQYSENQGLPNNLTRKMLFDHQGNLWIASYRSGLFQLTDGIFTCFSESEGLRENVVTSVIEIGQSTYWLGLEGGKVDVLKNGEIYPLKTNVDIPAARLKHMMLDSKGFVWISTYGGLLKLDLQGNAQELPKLPALDSFVRMTFEDSKGNIWIGTRRLGLYCLKADGNIIHLNANNGLGSNFVMSIDESPDGKLYVGTKAGVRIIKEGKVEGRIDMTQGLPTNMIFDVYVDDRIIWIATDLGLCKYSNNQVAVFDFGIGLSDNVVFDVVEGNDESLWLTSNTGVIRVLKSELEKVNSGKTVVSSSRLFDKADGMKSEQCVGAAKMFVDSQGTVWIPTISGVASLNPALIDVQHELPIPFIEKISTDQQSYYANETIKIEAGSAKRLKVFFTAFNYVAPNKVDFRYRLFPFDAEWQTAERLTREVTYTNLPPDEYTFEVKAGSNDVWNNTISRFEFSLKPHFYETKWFYFIILLGFVGVTYSIYNYRVKRTRMNEKELQKRVSERTDEILKQKEQIESQKVYLEEALTDLREAQTHLVKSEKLALLGQLTASVAHEINTPLGAIKSSIRSVNAYMENTISSLPVLLRSLNDNEVACFTLLLHEGIHDHQYQTPKDRRAIRTELVKKLREMGMEKPRKIADTLADYNITNRLDDFMPIIKHPNSAKLLGALGNLHNIIRGTNNIAVAAEKASKTVFALKNYAHIDYQKKKNLTNISKSIETVLTLYSSQIKQGVNVNKSFEELPMFYCYADELTQVWTNLIHNALHAMGNKGTLEISVKQNNDQAIVEISDSGSGIPEVIRDKIFQPFFTTKEAGEGSGLGLDIVKKIIDSHSGDISFESEEGMGTTFKVVLPIQLEES